MRSLLFRKPSTIRYNTFEATRILIMGLFLASCSAQPAPVPHPQPMFQPTTSVEDLMRTLVDPAADTLWDAVVITSTLEGLTEQQPETEEDWFGLERAAITLVESGNLLQMDDRTVAEAGSTSESPGIDLEPAEIAKLIDSNRQSWHRSARELHDAGTALLTAVSNRDINGLLDGGDRLYAACENCHSRFWYEDQTANRSAPPIGISPP